jgi:hypothetical protein
VEIDLKNVDVRTVPSTFVKARRALIVNLIGRAVRTPAAHDESALVLPRVRRSAATGYWSPACSSSLSFG